MDQSIQDLLRELLSPQTSSSSQPSQFYSRAEPQRRRQQSQYPFGDGYFQPPANYPARYVVNPRRSQPNRGRYWANPSFAPRFPAYGYPQFLYPDQSYFNGDDYDEDYDEQAQDLEDSSPYMTAKPQSRPENNHNEEEDDGNSDAQYRVFGDLLSPYFSRTLSNQQPHKYMAGTEQDAEDEGKDKETAQETQEPEKKEPEAVAGSDSSKSAATDSVSNEDAIKEMLLNALKRKEVPELVNKSDSASISNRPPIKRQSTLTHSSADASSALKIDPLQVSAPQTKTNLPFSPALNVYDFTKNYIVVISLPGVSKDFVDINYHPSSNELIIKGEVQNRYLSDDSTVDNSKILKVSEQRFGSFERVVKLPSFPSIHEDKIEAKFCNGLLEIKIPKTEEKEAKKVPRKITLEEVPDEELLRESRAGFV